MRILVSVILYAGLGLMAARAVTLPPLQGDVAGQLTLRGFGQVPPLDWRILAQPGSPGENLFQVDVTAPGLSVGFELQVTDNELISWRIIRGEVDIGRWWRPLSRRAGMTGIPEDMSMTGLVQMSGAGTIRGTAVNGRVTVDLHHGTVGSMKQNWTLSGLDVNTQLELGPEGPLVRQQHLRANEAEALGIKLHNLVLDAIGETEGRLTIQNARIDVLGGQVKLRPFSLDPAKLDIDTVAELNGVALGALADYIPQALSEASGQINGWVAVGWNAKTGAKTGGGSLTVESAAPASLRLAAMPGFLTQHTSERIQWLPDAFGPFARWMALENPAYNTLRRIEMGDLPLQVEKLQVQLYPDGPDGARSAMVEVVARPATGSAVEKVTFVLNVAGPLDQVLQLGSDERVKLNFGQKR
ncbi:MAG: YdbH domain-containing protein [Cephaloticoccus sp.]|nr:YdbH domain-containing protein [Cephaloticoccus sp.]MCF7759782.1 YdbH domain-containing protein [Cephaloticoccus sp.]